MRFSASAAATAADAATDATSGELIRIKDDRDLAPLSSSPPRRFCIMTSTTSRRRSRRRQNRSRSWEWRDLPHKVRAAALCRRATPHDRPMIASRDRVSAPRSRRACQIWNMEYIIRAVAATGVSDVPRTGRYQLRIQRCVLNGCRRSIHLATSRSS